MKATSIKDQAIISLLIKAIWACAERTVKEYITFLTFTKDRDDLKVQVKLLTVKLLSFILCCRSLKLDASAKLVCGVHLMSSSN